MNTIKDGGLSAALNGPRGSIDAWLEENSESEVRAAIRALISPVETMRDRFAAKAMPFYQREGWDDDEVAKRAYSTADAMLAAREVQS